MCTLGPSKISFSPPHDANLKDEALQLAKRLEQGGGSGRTSGSHRNCARGGAGGTKDNYTA